MVIGTVETSNPRHFYESTRTLFSLCFRLCWKDAPQKPRRVEAAWSCPQCTGEPTCPSRGWCSATWSLCSSYPPWGFVPFWCNVKPPQPFSKRTVSVSCASTEWSSRCFWLARTRRWNANYSLRTRVVHYINVYSLVFFESKSIEIEWYF